MPYFIKWATRIGGVLLLSMIINACTSTNAYLNNIPIEAGFVAIISPETFRSDIIHSNENLATTNMILDRFVSSSPNLAKYMKYILINPQENGILTQKEFALFKSNSGDSVAYYGILAHISGKEEFEIKNLQNLELHEIGYAKLIEDDYTYTLINRDMVVAWTDNHVLALIPATKDSRQHTYKFVKKYMALANDDAIISDKSFKPILGINSGLKLYVRNHFTNTNPELQKLYQKEQINTDLEGNIIVNFTESSTVDHSTLQLINQFSQELICE
ncbi:MAG: DUF4836 family protein [Bacteroidales bacterium]|nr:DUF4836 family protein [Bacteroidales bacterium]